MCFINVNLNMNNKSIISPQWAFFSLFWFFGVSRTETLTPG